MRFAEKDVFFKVKKQDFCKQWVGHPDLVNPREYLSLHIQNATDPIPLVLLGTIACIALKGPTPYQKQAREFYELLIEIGN